jgi:GNAT superfamily N-acetyltransferase
MLRALDYQGLADLRAMQELVVRTWREAGPPASPHVGDLPWRRFQHAGREREWRTRLWEQDGEVVAWAWLELPASLEVLVAPGRTDLVPSLIAWGEERAGTAVELDALLGTELAEALADLGFRQHDEEPMYWHSMPLGQLPEVRLPDGYRARHVRLPGDLARRVAVHRAAFGVARPSRVTEESYAAVASAWPYREELDWVVEAPDRSFASFCLIWPDEENRVGLLEPVGTHPDHWRRGLGRAVCAAALRALRDTGAETAVVLAVSDEARALYRSLGFDERSRYAGFRRS